MNLQKPGAKLELAGRVYSAIKDVARHRVRCMRAVQLTRSAENGPVYLCNRKRRDKISYLVPMCCGCCLARGRTY